MTNGRAIRIHARAGHRAVHGVSENAGVQPRRYLHGRRDEHRRCRPMLFALVQAGL